MQQQPESAHRRASTSSSACSTAPRRQTVGCIAGLLRLFSPYHRGHHRKRLTAKNNATTKQPPSSSPAPSPSSTPKKKAETSSPSPAFLSPAKPKPVQQQQQPAAVRRRRSCDAPRSPTIAPEHRRTSCDDSSGPSPPPSAIVARLMGLEESAPPSPATAPRPVLPTRPPPPPPPHPESTAAEKRRKLLGALEKCDEDLKTLRRIIAAVRAAETRASDVLVPAAATTTTTTPPGNNKGAYKWPLGRVDRPPSPSSPQPQHRKPRGEEQYQYLSPDSVLDAIVSSPRFPCRKRPSPCADNNVAGYGNNYGAVVVPSSRTKIVKPSRTFVFSGGYCKIMTGDEPQLLTAAGVHRRAAVPTVLVATDASTFLPRAAGAEGWRRRRLWELETAAAAGRVISRATVECVGEVWGQQPEPCGAADEQRWERAGRDVAAALERAVLQDLVSDVVAELLAQSGHGHVGAGCCRKRLCF